MPTSCACTTSRGSSTAVSTIEMDRVDTVGILLNMSTCVNQTWNFVHADENWLENVRNHIQGRRNDLNNATIAEHKLYV